MPTWDPRLYLDFGKQRTRAAEDLCARLRPAIAAGGELREGLSILDLGCGPGNSTAELRRTFPEARLAGLDSSPDMIAAARGSGLDAEWILADGRAWEAASAYDLVFSNAVLQWMGDQERMLERAFRWTAGGGLMAHQVPGNGGSPLHRALCDAAGDPAWKARSPTGFSGLDDAIRYREPGFYVEALASLGAVGIDLWETTYWHVLGSRADLIAWYSGTGMRPWLDALESDRAREEFKADVLERASASYPERADGSVLFPFRRIFFTAAKPRPNR
jgi:trans-aconitate 2-methyltransferase